MALINGRTYSWPDVEVRLLGNTRPIAGITEISWKDDNERQFHHGSGKLPVSYSEGKSSYSGSMKLHLDEVQAIKKSLGISKLRDIPPFDLVISYVAGLKLMSETLASVLITGEDHTNASGGAALEVNISFQFSDVITK